MITFRNILVLLAAASVLTAQSPAAGPEGTQQFAGPTTYRLELGGYGTDYNHGAGWWRGVDTTLWIRKSPSFIPALSFDDRTTDFGTQRSYSVFSYANWTPAFFTTQAISGSLVATGTQLFPRFRYDLKAWWKLRPSRRLVAGIGATRYTFAGSLSGLILNPGALYYKNSFVFDAEAFVNRTSPGGLWSGSGLFALQQGQEGKHWRGVSIGAGRQIYRAVQSTPFDAGFSNFSIDAFYRKWLTRRFGVVFNAGYQTGSDSLRRFSMASHIFFEFN